MKTIIEPFRIKSVEPIRMTTRDERKHLIREANYNLFALDSESVLIDFLTDSGTTAMSAAQWASMMRGDESYAGSPSFHRFEAAIRELMPFRHIIPTHQGRAAEKILFTITGGAGRLIPSNTHFDTTRANVEFSGAEAIDLVCKEAADPASTFPFKGNMDVEALRRLLAERRADIPLVMLTITNNSNGGQPVSMANIRATHEACRQAGVPLFIDACRFAENAYFIKMLEDGFSDWSVKDIVRETFRYAEGMTMSAKKDGLVNIGGWLALNDDAWALEARNLLILTEGFPTYGGLAGRDLDAIATGLEEVVEEDYLKYRIASTQYLGNALTRMGVPIIEPVGGHAVYIRAGDFLAHIPPLHYPGQALAVALYEVGGIRSCEIGSVMFGRRPDGSEVPARVELVRLAIPRRVYTQSHVDYVIECFEEVVAEKDSLTGYRITWEPPALRHFTAHFEPVGRGN
jgi:tyrosine phenol-lyase